MNDEKRAFKNKILLGKLLGELYKSQRKMGTFDPDFYFCQHMLEEEIDDHIDGLINGFEHLIDQELVWTDPVSSNEYENVFTLLQEFNDEDMAPNLTDYYKQIHPNLMQTISRSKIIKILQQFYKEGRLAMALERLVSDDIRAPTEFKGMFK